MLIHTHSFCVTVLSGRWLVVLVLLLLLSACGGLNEQSVKQAEQLEKQLDEHLQKIRKIQQRYEQFMQTDKGRLYAVYAQREQLASLYHQALSKLDNSRLVYQNKVKAVLDRDDADDNDQLINLIARIRVSIKQANLLARKPMQRIEALDKARQNHDKYVNQALQAVTKSENLLARAKKQKAKVSKDFAHKTKKINQYFTPFLQKYEQMQSAFQKLQKIHQLKIEKKDYDLAVFADSYQQIIHNHQWLDKALPRLLQTWQQPYQSYTKILTDMRIDYYVRIGRTSWNNYLDYPTEHTYYFTSKVDKRVAEYFDKLPDMTLAGISYRFYVRLRREYWDALRITNPKEGWPSGDTMAEFWFAGLSYRYYHRYKTIRNQSQQQSDWIEVDAKTYWRHEANLGMSIVSKPYGYFEDEKINQAIPPFMDYIATPQNKNGIITGRNQYGAWQMDQHGNSVWQFLAAYAFLNALLPGQQPYRYQDWQAWHKRKPLKDYYYGGRYGTYGSYTWRDGRYRNSTYSRQNPQVRSRQGRESLRKKNTSIRGAGPRSRGRGPTAGGK